MRNDMQWATSELLPDLTLDSFLNGSIRLVEMGRSGAMCRLIVCRQARPDKGALSLRERSVVRRLALGQCQKVVAYDFGLAHTTVSSHLRGALDKLGLGRWEHAVLVAAALEAPGTRVEPLDDVATSAPAWGTCGPFFGILCELSQSSLLALTEAEREVALLVVDGCANSEIGVRRRSSPRTVANQISSVFRKLRVHGRCELIRSLLLAHSPGVSLAENSDTAPQSTRRFPGLMAEEANGAEIAASAPSSAVG
jgi:DNA-binding CsgD family transcriptional regulator